MKKIIERWYKSVLFAIRFAMKSKWTHATCGHCQRKYPIEMNHEHWAECLELQRQKHINRQLAEQLAKQSLIDRAIGV